MASLAITRPSPTQMIALSFLAAIVIGAILLSLPWAQAAEQRLSLLDVLFTAASAVCVTGLVVVDTGSAFSRFGQVVILLLFQLGGIGILTYGALLVLATGRRLRVSDRIGLKVQINAFETGGVLALVRAIVVWVLVIELLGTLLLFVRFRQLTTPTEALFQALFHSLSAFNNAGFALFSDSLMSFVSDPLVNLTIMALIILGGLGFIVLVELIQQVRSRLVEHQRPHLSLHSKLVLVISGSFIASAMVVLMILEWNNPATLGPLGLTGKLLASLFQAITPRTAGFYTLDYGQLQTPSIIFSMLLMFIGGNPGSTAGGIKTITFVVLALSTWRVIRGQKDLNIFGRRLLTETVERAGVIAFGGIMVVGAALTLLTITEPEQDFLKLLFETVSAFATVGLSTGITSELTALGKCVIIVLMYLGRIGLLTFALALVAEQPEGDLRYPAEDVVIG